VTRIARIETNANDDLAIVRVHTDDGAVGTGQTGARDARITVGMLHAYIAPHYLGTDPWSHQVAQARCVRTTYKLTGSQLFRALAGVDTAIWDLLGQLTGRSVHELWGGAVRDEVPMYGSSMRRDTVPEAEAEALAAAIEHYGFRAVKFKIGSRMGEDDPAARARTVRLIPLVRQRLGDDVALAADANGAYTAAEAIRIGRRLDALGYYHFEEPCPFTDLHATARVAAALDVQVAGGEQDHVMTRFADMIRLRAVNVLQFDVGYLGGASRGRRVAELAEAFGLTCTPHCGNHSLLQVFTLHLSAAMPAIDQFQEWCITDDRSWAEALYEPVLVPRDGKLRVPTGAGWGITVNDDLLRGLDRRVSEVMT